MGFQVSPGVVVTEKDLTGIVPAVSTTDGGFAGVFTWGPLNDITLIGNEAQLVKKFGKPNQETFTSFFTAANFLAYGDKLRLVRVADGGVAKNATADKSGLLIKNDADYDDNFMDGSQTKGNWAARHPGVLGNGLKVSICPSPEAFQQNMVGTYSAAIGATTIVGAGIAAPEEELIPGSIIRHAASNQERKVVSIDAGANSFTIDKPLTSAIPAGATLIARWEFADVFGIAPGTSELVAQAGGTRDELHVVVVDATGAFTGTAGTVVEKYAFLSKASDNRSADGASTYYKEVINRQSEYVRWLDHAQTTTWGNKVGDVDYLPLASSAAQLPVTDVLGGGVDGNDTTSNGVLSARIAGYDLFANADTVDVSLIMLGEANLALVGHVINNICEVRKDCVAFFSPEYDDVVFAQTPVENTIDFKISLGVSSSYAVMDSGWKKQYDKYSDVYRWVPLNGDIAGICVRTDVNQDPWWSPAGYNRGQVKNTIQLAYNPFKAERDDLYIQGINPVITTQGQGTILFGDKTLLAKPSAFDRINVRRLFIVLEKAIARAAKFMLFEFNDEFTRQQFRNLVEPFLRDVQARRGIYDFKVVCDRTNNTAEVIDRNEFVGDIYIKPARAINFIQLNFIAVRTGVDFSEIVGKA